MERQNVTKQLKELHQELERAPELRQEDRDLLAQLLRDIQAVLDKTEGAPHVESIRERLEDAAHRFEVTHPSLTEVVARVINGLSNMGI